MSSLHIVGYPIGARGPKRKKRITVNEYCVRRELHLPESTTDILDRLAQENGVSKKQYAEDIIINHINQFKD